MTPKELQHIAAILNACAEGQQIQKYFKNEWHRSNLEDDKLDLLLAPYNYRIKPKLFEGWVGIYHNNMTTRVEQERRLVCPFDTERIIKVREVEEDNL